GFYKSDASQLPVFQVFPGFVDIANRRFIDQETGAPIAAQLDAVFVIPFNDSLHLVAIFHDHHHRGFALHLLLVVKIFGVGLVGGRDSFHGRLAIGVFQPLTALRDWFFAWRR